MLPTVATIVTLPGARPLTSPDCVTVAIVVSLLDQLTGRLLSALFDASYAVASNCVLLPVVTDEAAGMTLTLVVTAGTTTSGTSDVWPPPLTPMLAEPEPIAVMTPAESTIATEGSVVNHESGTHPAIDALAASVGSATPVMVCPTTKVLAPSLSDMLATGGTTPMTEPILAAADNPTL